MSNIKIKFSSVLKQLQEDIIKGKYPFGHQLPTESELAAKYKVSRPTIAKAYDQLKEKGLVEKKAGAGTFIIYKGKTTNKLIGLLLPGAGESEIFELIFKQISNETKDRNISCLWDGAIGNDAELRKKQILEICNDYIKKGVMGILFSPLERAEEKDDLNKKVCKLFEKHKIPLVLIDRDIVTFPERSNYDLIGIDNYKAAYEMASHLMDCKCRRIVFFHRPFSAPTVYMRQLGIQGAISNSAADISFETVSDNPENIEIIQKIVKGKSKTGIICANDATAAALLSSLRELKIAVPDDIKIVGFDDMKYARHLYVPLTTYRQPAADIGTSSIDLLMNRIANPNLATITLSLKGELIKRDSTR
jgi:GntR family transcriptional regulator, arabinose operon transcriptional repressor